MISAMLRGRVSPWRAYRQHVARKRLGQALAHCAAGHLDEGKRRCESALELAPRLAEAHYLLGLIACRGDAAQAGHAAIQRAIELEPAESRYLAALGDALLLLQRPEEAVLIYARAFPRVAADLDRLPERDLPWRKAHPVWMQGLMRVTSPLDLLQAAAGPHEPVFPGSAAEPAHLLNWALVLITLRRVPQAMHLLGESLALNSGLGYAQAVLALLRTLNRDWDAALAAALKARSLGEDTFAGSTALCVLAAQLGRGAPAITLDPIFDWSAFGADGDSPWQAGELPPLEGLPFPAIAQDALVYFVACDPRYFLEYGLALACSIQERAGRGHIHFHFFNPTPESWAAWQELRVRLSSLAHSATWERVDYEGFGGQGFYCINARFARLYQLLESAAPGARVVMLDADSLVRADPTPALAAARDIAVAHAPGEPFWHEYLGGFTAFRATPLACAFLRRLGRFLATNLANGRARRFMDQLALYVSVHRREPEATLAVDELPAGLVCDTLFTEGALIWSVTVGKAQDSAFERERRSILERYGSGTPRPPVSGDRPAGPSA